ncbi:MAG: hypothetical protein LBI44_04675 [Oscillospiraceae bacterium]|nr:hypothetical protein [Oscillospiraceae bacterium]
MGLSNILPLKINGLATDGHNAVSLRKSPQARRAMWVLLSAHARFALGARCRDLPPEWFVSEGGDDDFNNPIIANMAALRLGRMMDTRAFAEAKDFASRALREGGKMPELMKNELRCELLFLETINEPRPRAEEVERLRTPELQKYIRQSKTHLSKHRITYAYEKLIARNEGNAAKALEGFRKTCLAYPYAGDCESERELMAIIDGKASAV